MLTYVSVGSPLWGTGARDVPTVALDALAVLLFLLVLLAPTAILAVWAGKLVCETPVAHISFKKLYSFPSYLFSLEASLGAPRAVEVVGVIVAGEALPTKGVVIVAHLISI